MLFSRKYCVVRKVNVFELIALAELSYLSKFSYFLEHQDKRVERINGELMGTLRLSFFKRTLWNFKSLLHKNEYL